MIFIKIFENQKTVKHILDGQQRITTFFLLIKAIIVEGGKYYSRIDTENVKIDANTTSEFQSCVAAFESWLRNGNNVRLKSNYIDDVLISNIYFNREYSNGINKHTDSHKRIIESYEKLKAVVKVEFFDETAKLSEKKFLETISRLNILIEYLTTSALILPLEVEDIYSAYTLFESMNNTGAKLEQEDLLKNHFYKSVKNKNNHSKITSFWKDLSESMLDEKGNSFGLSNFLLYYFQSKYGDIRKNQLFKSIKDKTSSDSAVFNEIESISKYAKRLKKLIQPDKNHFKDASTVVALNGLKSMGIKIAYIPLLRILDVIDDDMKKFSSAIKIIRDIFLVHVKVGGNPTNLLQSYFATDFCPKLNRNNLTVMLDSLREKFYLSEQDFDLLFNSMTPSNSLSKYILLEIEMRNKKGQFLNIEKFDLEHIIPKNINNSDWIEDLTNPKTKKLESDSFSLNQKNIKYIDTIGNHTLWFSEDNRSKKNSGFSTKKTEYENSAVDLTKELGNKSKFVYADVNIRTNEIREKLKKGLKLFP